MLEELHVKNLALIEEAWLEFGPGMTVLTGETGAGKTALVGALKLLLGERADSTLVRSGSDVALVEGRFCVAGEEVLARRTLTAEGRSKCALDGEMATVGLLAERLGTLVDLHGQHDHQSLLRPGTHVGYLDRYVGEPALIALQAYRDAREAHDAAARRVTELEETLADGERRADYLRFVIGDIDAVSPEPDEDVLLEQRLPILRNADRLARAAGEAHAAVRGEGGAADLVAGGHEVFRRLTGLDPELDRLSGRLDELMTLLDDLGMELRSYQDSVSYDPQELDRVEGRMAVLSGLMKKYGPRLSDVVEMRLSAASELAVLEAGEDGIEQARREASAAHAALERRASDLRAVRNSAIPQFVESLSRAVADLAMEGATFEVAVTELSADQWTSDGPDRIEFLYAAAPGQPCRPLVRIASGGEVSRVMLALKGVLGEADDVPILVFDEVDAGIGGATAHSVGRRLRELADTHQVLVITHLAQVAVHADTHLVVSKHLRDGVARTEVERVAEDERVAEIARMLSGGESMTSHEHARELIAAAKGDS